MLLQRISRWLLTRRSVQTRLRRWLLTHVEAEPDFWVGPGEGAVHDTTFYGYRLFQRWGWQARIHAFYNADTAGGYHSHPSRAYRLVLSGGYVEEVLTRDPTGRLPPLLTRVSWTEGMFGRIEPELTHRVHALIRPCHHNNYRGSAVYEEDPTLPTPTFTLWIRGPTTHQIHIDRLE